MVTCFIQSPGNYKIWEKCKIKTKESRYVQQSFIRKPSAISCLIFDGACEGKHPVKTCE